MTDIVKDGQFYTVPAENLQKALAAGYQLAGEKDYLEKQLQEQFGSTSGAVKAGAAGLARGASFGLSDLLLTKGGFVSSADLKEYRERNKGVSTAAEIGGAVIPGLVTGGTGTGASLAKTIGIGALEGGFFGAGQALSESVLDNTDLTAEKLVAQAGMGAVLGGAGAAGVYGLSKGINKALGAATKKFGARTEFSIDDALKNFEEENAVKAIVGNGNLRAIKALDSRGRINEVGKFALDNGLLAGSPSERAQAAGAIMERAGKEMEEELVAGAGKLIDGNDIADVIERKYAKALESGTLGQKSVARKMMEEAQNLRAMGQITPQQMELMKRGFQESASEAGRAASPLQVGYDELAGAARKAVEEAVDSTKFIDAKKAYGLAADVQKFSEELAQRQFNNRGVSLSDYIAGVGGLASGSPFGVLAAGANKLVREHGRKAAALLVRRIRQSPEAGLIAKALKKQINVQLETPDAFGAVRPFVSNIASKADDEFLASHMYHWLNNPQYRAVMEESGFSESPDQSEDTFGRVAGLASLKRSQDSFDSAMDEAVGHLVDGTRPKREAKKDEFNYDDLATRLVRLQTDPDAAVAELAPGEVGNYAPGVSMAMTQVAQRAAQYLHQVMPKRPGMELPEAVRPQWKPSRYELESLKLRLKAIDDPKSVLNDMAHGRAAQESIDALKSIYPSIFDDLKRRAAERLATAKKPLGYNQKKMFSILLENPDIAGVNQLIRAKVPVSGPEQRQPSINTGKIDSSQVLENFQTQFQRIEGR